MCERSVFGKADLEKSSLTVNHALCTCLTEHTYAAGAFADPSAEYA